MSIRQKSEHECGLYLNKLDFPQTTEPVENKKAK